MAYDDGLAERIRLHLDERTADVSEKKMFGGVAFLHKGRMFLGLATDDLMVRVGPARYEEALAQPHVRPMDFTGKPMRGYIFVTPRGHEDDIILGYWIDWAFSFVQTLPVKSSKKMPKKMKDAKVKSPKKRGEKRKKPTKKIVRRHS